MLGFWSFSGPAEAQPIQFDFSPWTASLPREEAAGPTALSITLERDRARSRDRWIDVHLAVHPEIAGAGLSLDEVVLRATLRRMEGTFDILAKETAQPGRERGLVRVDLRTLGVERAWLSVELLAGSERLALADTELSAEPIVALPPGKRIPVRLDIPDKAAFERGYALSFGMPMPPGALWKAHEVRLVDDDGRELAAQSEILARWSREGSIRWLRFDTIPPAEGGLWLEVGPADPDLQSEAKVTLQEYGDRIEVDTGTARYLLNDRPGGPIHAIWHEGQKIAGTEEVRGLYVVDQQGRTARSSIDKTSVEAVGPMTASVRFDGRYLTADGEAVARHITRLEFHAGRNDVRITHTFILSRDTNDIWFREIGWELAADVGGGRHAVFATQHGDPLQDTSFPLAASDDQVYLLQADHEQFGGGEHRGLIARHGDAVPLREMSRIGEWAALVGDRAALMWVCPNAALLHPKAFEIEHDRLRLVLFSPRAGEELDFRPAALAGRWNRGGRLDGVEHTGRGADPEGPLIDVVRDYQTNAAGWSRTHEITLHPLPPKATALGPYAQRHTQPILAMADPDWIMETAVFGPMHPYDPGRFPEAEGLTEEAFDYWMTQGEEIGSFGFIDFGVGPHFRVRFPAHYRYRLGYRVRSGLWRQALRTGRRDLLRFAQVSTRDFADRTINHDQTEREDHIVQGLYLRGGNRILTDRLPYYWEFRTTPTLATSSDMMIFLADYFISGHRRSLDIIRAYGEGVKQWWRPAYGRSGRIILILNDLAQLYGVTWDPGVREVIEQMAGHIHDPEGAIGLTKERPNRSSTYKVRTDVTALIELWEFFGTPRYHEMALRSAEHFWEQAVGGNPSRDRMEFGRLSAFLYEQTGNPAVLQSMDIALRQGTAHSSAVGASTAVYRLQEKAYLMKPLAGVEAAKPFTAWAGVDAAEEPITFWVYKPITDHELPSQALRCSYESVNLYVTGLPGERGSWSGRGFGRVRLRPADDRTLPPELSQYREIWHGGARVTLPKDANSGAYAIEPMVEGQPFVLADKPFPLVLHAPGRWQPMASLSPPPRIYFNLPEGTGDGRIYFEKATKLLDAEGEAYPEAGAITGWIDLPEGSAGMWSFVPAEPGQVEVENVPPFFTFEDPDHYFEPPVD